MDQSNIHLLKIPNREELRRKAEWLQEHGFYTHLSIIQLTDLLESKLEDKKADANNSPL